MPEERLQKILSRAGVASRRQAEKIMLEGRVTVNGAVVIELGSKADLETDHIKVDGKLIRAPKNKIFCRTSVHGVVDRDAIARVMQNLVSNALKLTPPGGDVRVSLRGGEDTLRVEVSDHGPGIAAEHHPKIFEKFGQLDTNVRQSIASSGLGLYFCKLAVEAHGGRIGVESQVGQGSTFWFELPLQGPATPPE